MNFYKHIRLSNWLGYVLALSVAIATILISNRKVKQLKKEESIKITNYAKTLELLNTEYALPAKTQVFLVQLIEQNTTIPVILVDEKNKYLDSKNVDTEIISSPRKLKKELQKMKALYAPISINLPFGKQYVYYKNSMLLTQLEYYPILLLIIIALFLWFSYWYFRILRKTEQSLLWAGMAKETAHQIGTPLSSIMGWIEILKYESIDQKPIKNIERDINRLLTITDRFSKIGSAPVLAEFDLVEVTRQAFNYLKNRVSQHIEFQFQVPDHPIFLQLNIPLFSWVIENLIKNAADAMKGEGTIKIKIQESSRKIYVDISDTGSGIPLKNYKRIFKPGFTTKKRGWGLGLSLARRIIENFHYGKIFVLNSEIQKGTTFRIVLKK